MDQFVAFVLPLSAVGTRIRTLLDVASSKRIRGVARTGRVLCLVDIGSFRRKKPLLLTMKVKISFRERDTGDGAHFFVDGEQQFEISLNRDSERINPAGGSPFRCDRFLGSESHGILLKSCRCFGDLEGSRGGFLHGLAAQVIRRAEAPGTVSNNANTQAEGLGIRGLTQLAVFGGQRAASSINDTGVGVRCASLVCHIQSPVCDLLHGSLKSNTARTLENPQTRKQGTTERSGRGNFVDLQHASRGEL